MAEAKYLQKKEKFTQLQHKYEQNGSTTWEQFAQNQEANRQKIVLLTSNDFKYGTLRVKQPCLLRFTESVEFNPNRPSTWLDATGEVTNNPEKAWALDPARSNDWMPDPTKSNNAQYFLPEVSFAYGLGFFAAIAIEAIDVIVDLNGFTLQQHREHHLQQRFYANIELADQPFIPFQGPSNFGAVLRSAKNIYIHNGKLGRASHHAIHGNNNTGVLLENLTIEDFEVAAVHLNGANDVVVKRVNVVRNLQQVPVLATYSVGRFLKLFANRLVVADLSSSAFAEKQTVLNYDLDRTFNSVIFNNGVVPTLFANPSGQIDGNPYGMVFNPTGIAVNGFLPTRQTFKSNETSRITIIDSSINGISGRVDEIPALARLTPDGNIAKGAIVDTAGALVQVFNGVAEIIENRMYYRGTSLSDLQVEVARLAHSNPESSRLFGTLNIDKAFVIWADNSDLYLEHDGYSTVTLKTLEGKDYLENGHAVKYRVLCNGDCMFHVNKGVMGLRIDGASDWSLQNLTISNIKNTGKEGSLYAGHYLKSHPLQQKALGYNGNDTYGLVASATNIGEIDVLQVLGIESATGTAKGIAIQYESCNINLGRALVRDVKAGVGSSWTPSQSMYPNVPPRAYGLVVEGSCHNVDTSNLTIIEVSTVTETESENIVLKA